MMSKQLALAFSQQSTGFKADPCPSLMVRLDRIERLRRMVIDSRDAFRAALVEDFGSHHVWLTDLMETGPVLGRCNYFLAHLAECLSPERLDLGPERGRSHGEKLLLP